MEAACSQCGRLAFRRGLCVTCYRQARQAGPVRRLRPVDEVIEDVEWMIATGETHPETVAARLGYAIKSLAVARRQADGVELRDLVLAMGACTDSNFAHQYRLPGTFAPTASFELLEKAVQTAREKNLRYRVGNVVTSDIFYGDCENETAEWKKMGVLAVEMETAALYMTAARAGKQALSITTVSDLPLKGESTSSEERQKTFTQMMEVALTVASEAVDGHDK